MIKTEKISVIQLLIFIIMNRFLFGFSYMPTVTIAPANQDAWIADIVSGIMILVFAIPILILSSRFKGMSFHEYFEVILGKFAGKALNFFYALYLTFICLLTVIFLADFLMSAVMPETPMYAMLAVMLIPCIYASYKGIECIGRVSIILGIMVFFFIILYAILNFNNMDFKVFQPVLYDSSITQLTFGAFNNAARFCDCFVFFLFIAYVDKGSSISITKTLIVLVVIFTLMNTLLTIVTQSVLGTGYAKTLRYPYFISIQHISLFNIIQRIELYNIIGWIVIFFFKLSSTFLAASIILKQIFGVKSHKVFIIPLNLIVVLSILFTSISYYAVFKKVITEYAYLAIFTANFIIPFIVLMVYLLRKKALT